MRLKTLLPTGIVVDEDVARVRIDTKNGSMTFLPNHADFLTALTAGIVSYRLVKEGKKTEDVFMACDQGILVKEGDKISLSVRKAIISDDLEYLTKLISEDFKRAEEERKRASVALAKLEVGLTKGLLRLTQGGR